MSGETEGCLILIFGMDFFKLKFTVNRSVVGRIKSLIKVNLHDLSLIFFTLKFPVVFFLLDLMILYVPSTIFQLYRDGSSWVEPVLS